MALSGYIGARWDRRATKEWYVPSGTADDTLLPDSQTLRDRSRDLIRNTPLATGAVNTVVQNVVGGGLQLQARPEWEALEMSEDQADEWKAGVEREFRLWAEGTECDITRTQNFYGLQDLVFRAVLEAGDCAVLTPMIPARTSPYSLRLQVIEAERLANPDGKQAEGGRRVRRERRASGPLFGADVGWAGCCALPRNPERPAVSAFPACPR